MSTEVESQKRDVQYYQQCLLKGILDQLNYLGGIGPLCTHVQVLATWTHLNGWLEQDVFAIGLQQCCQDRTYSNSPGRIIR